MDRQNQHFLKTKKCKFSGPHPGPHWIGNSGGVCSHSCFNKLSGETGARQSWRTLLWGHGFPAMAVKGRLIWGASKMCWWLGLTLEQLNHNFWELRSGHWCLLNTLKLSLFFSQGWEPLIQDPGFILLFGIWFLLFYWRKILHMEKQIDCKCASWRIVTRRTYLCNQHLGQDIDHDLHLFSPLELPLILSLSHLLSHNHHSNVLCCWWIF